MNNRELARTTCFDNMAAFGKTKATAFADAAAKAKPSTRGGTTPPKP